MKGENKKQTAAFSLIEVVVAIAILGMVTIPLGGGLVLSHRLNARSEQMIQARLDVSNAVEVLMAEGIVDGETYTDRFPDVTVTLTPVSDEEAYQATVKSKSVDTVSVVTYIRPASADASETGGASG